MTMPLRPIGRRIALRGFTLIEVLVVVAIIALLISILLPSLQRAREEAKSVVCMARLHSLSIAFSGFTSTHNGYYPEANLWFDNMNNTYGKFGWMASPDYRTPQQGGYYDAPFGPNEKGYIARYMAKDINGYMCPADDGYRFYKNFSLGGPYSYFMALPPRLSYMMNADIQNLWRAPAANPKTLERKDINGEQCVFTESVFIQSPAKVMLLMEESSLGPMNDPYVEWLGYQSVFADDAGSQGGAYLASRHNKRGSLLMFDSHAESIETAKINAPHSNALTAAQKATNRAANRRQGLLFGSLYVAPWSSTPQLWVRNYPRPVNPAVNSLSKDKYYTK
jgi:prepilin-type N-terminal cleavage/methylation domain-containing protein